MAKRSKAIQQKATPSVVYEYVYDILKDKLSVTKHGMRHIEQYYTRDDVTLDNGATLNSRNIFEMHTPTQSLFKYPETMRFDPECAFLAGFAWSRLERGEVLDVAHRISKSLLKDHVSALSRHVEEARANMNKACNELKAADAIYRAYAEKLEKTDE